MKLGNLSVEMGKPLQFTQLRESDTTAGQSEPNLMIADFLKAYRLAAREFLKGKYVCYADFAPVHLREPCDVFVIQCIDGIFVRHDAASKGPGLIRITTQNTTLAEIAPKFSDYFVHIGDNPELINLDNSPGIAMHVVDPTGVPRQTFTSRLGVFSTGKLPDGFQLPKPPVRPFPLLSVTSEFDLHMDGVVGPADVPHARDGPDVQQFLAHGRLQLAVGWKAIEIYPLLGDEFWQPSLAATWAELDILAIAAQRNLQDVQLAALDSRGDSRRKYAALLREFDSLLQGQEEPLHQFLRGHPELISPTSDKHWSKVPFGATISDFVFREPHNDYELVEIEAPSRQLFRQDGQQHGDLTHAINQTTDWVRYIEDNKKTVESELALSGISTNPRRLVVIGRSNSLSEQNRRKLVTIQNEQPKLRIVTYDDLLAAARTNLERILGPLDLVAENLKLYFFK